MSAVFWKYQRLTLTIASQTYASLGGTRAVEERRDR